MTDDQRTVLHKPEFPRSNGYDVDWVLDHQMGPNPLWLAEWLCERVPVSDGARVLDLGCGKAMTSIFLAREFGAHVFAVDLWMQPEGNMRRARDAGVADRVCPMKGEAHTLPFAPGWFDAAVSFDAYQYFGTDELYLDYLASFVRPGGWLGVVVVGLTRELTGGVPPPHFTEPQSNGKVFWEPSCRCFKTAAFWKSLWSGSSLVHDVTVDVLPDGWCHWRDFEDAIEKSGKGYFPSDSEALTKDGGDTIGFIRLTARRTETVSENFYDAGLGERLRLER